MCVIIAISGAILFILLTPGLLLRVPSKGSLLTASIIHSIVFAILFYFITMFVYSNYNKIESFKNKKNKKICRKAKKVIKHLNKFARIIERNKVANIPQRAKGEFAQSLIFLDDIRNSKSCMK